MLLSLTFLEIFAAEGQVPHLSMGWVPYHSETYHSETYHSEFLPFEVGDPAHRLLIIQKLIIQKMHYHYLILQEVNCTAFDCDCMDVCLSTPTWTALDWEEDR